MTLPKKFLSFSQIDLYLNCPRKYKFIYVDNLQSKVIGEALILGKSIHDILAEILMMKMGGKKQTAIQTLLKKYRPGLRKTLKQTSDSQKELGLPGLKISELLYQHDALIEQWVKDIFPELNPTAVEKKVEIQIGGYPFVAYIDLIHANKRIIDWKVTKSPKTKKKTNDSLQLSLYGICSGLPIPIEVGFISLVRPKINSKRWKPTIQSCYSTRLQTDLNWAEEIVQEVGRSIEAGNFPPCSPENYLCTPDYCDCWLICRGKTKKPEPEWLKEIVTPW